MSEISIRHSDCFMTDSRGNKQLSYFYSNAGLLLMMQDSDGNRTDYDYDPTGRLTGIWAPNNDYTAFAYDDAGRLIEKWFPNGVNAQYSYNRDNTLKQLTNRHGAGITISQHDYTYDGVGNRSTHNELIGGTTNPYSYAYDALNRLTTVTNTSTSAVESYAYDPLGNRSSKTAASSTLAYVYDAANQLTEIRQGSITGTLLGGLVYDNNGNLTKKCESGTVTVSSSNCTGSTVTDLTHDTFNRLAQVAKTSISTESYKYDDQGNRIQKTVGGTITNFLYNGPDVIGQYTSTWGTASAILTHGPGMDDPIVRTAGTTTQYFHQDGLGSVVSVTNQSGTTDGTARYDAWGNKIASTGTIPQYGYTGREPDDTGLVYYRARFYDPSIGRFTQTDPIGMRGGMNLYAYVNGNPTNFNDPMGLIASSPTNSVNVGSNGEVTVNEISYASNNNSGITSACQCMGEQYAAASTGVSLSDAGNGAGPKYTIDANGAASIASYETFKDHVYDDGYGNFTIGIGHKVLAGETFPAKITQEYALQLFQKDVNKIVQPGLDKITVPLQQHQINALGSLIFNIGTPQFLASSVYTQLQAQNYDQVPSRMLLYDLAYNAILQQKQYSQGLHNRRIVEGLEFMGYGFNFP